MNPVLYLVIASVSVVYTQENAQRNVPPSLLECYNTTHLLERDNRLPQNINTFIAILRKIENTESLNMDLRSLSVALLHRFRQDGIERNPAVQAQDGVTPYAPNGLQYSRHAAMLRLIPGNAVTFPNNSLTDIERCTLHFMLSSSIELFERGDEGTVCRVVSSSYRIPRGVDDDRSTKNIKNDVEILSPEQVETMKSNKVEPKIEAIDPNWAYPEYPPNHPVIARYIHSYAKSNCPVENGVIKTPWGAVSGGPLLAGIAAALQPQTIRLDTLLREDLLKEGYATGEALDNKWIATLAGDLAEVALIQAPKVDNTLSVGANGNWNSTALPRWYFLGAKTNLEFTTAEIRGDLDGLILAQDVPSWYSKVSSLRLSQIFDMYYSARGVFNSMIRACNRRTLLTTVAPNDTMTAQAYSAAVLLHEDLARSTIAPPAIEKFATQATNLLTTFIPNSMNDDLSCTETDQQLSNRNRASVDLTIVLDTNWPFASIQPILATLLEDVEIGLFNSNFTLINGYDGTVMIERTNTILDFYSFNTSNYSNFTSGFDLPKSFETLLTIQAAKLDEERNLRLGGKSSDVVLVIPYTTSISDTDKDYCLERLKTVHEEVPDATVLFLTYGSKDRWSNLVLDSATDIFSIGTGDTADALVSLQPLVSRIKRIPKRLINSQCGAGFTSSGSSAAFVDYVEPSGVNFYRLHPNYFFTSDTTNVPTVKVQGSGWGSLTVCTSREVLNANANEAIASASCSSLTANEHSVTVPCTDASLIHECAPLYISVSANASSTTSYQCTDPRVCRFPDMIKYTISYQNLVCASSASAIVLTPFVFIWYLIYISICINS